MPLLIMRYCPQVFKFHKEHICNDLCLLRLCVFESGCGHTQDFATVKGQHFRLMITGSKGEVPVLNEWILNSAL
jgi:hypothetical protein